MILHERIEKLTTGKREYNRLFKADNLYIVWINKNVDKFVEAIEPEYYTSRDKLVGRRQSEAKLENKKVTGEPQGYIFVVSKKQEDMFEKAALMPSMKYSCRFEKYDLNKIKQQEQEEIMARLSEEN